MTSVYTLRTTHIIDRLGLCMLLLPIVEIFGTRDLHSKSQVTEATGQVCLHKDVTRIQVPVSNAWFHLLWKQKDTHPFNHCCQAGLNAEDMCSWTHLLSSHLCAGGLVPLLQIKTSCRMWSNPIHSSWGSLAERRLGHMTKPASTPHSSQDSLFQCTLQTEQLFSSNKKTQSWCMLPKQYGRPHTNQNK
jgi:hypothetical protein